jgi:hypothetical protein
MSLPTSLPQKIPNAATLKYITSEHAWTLTDPEETTFSDLLFRLTLVSRELEHQKKIIM